MKRIFIAIPVYQYPTPECMESVINLVGIFRDKYDLTVRLVSGYTAEVARTKSVEAFLATQCDYLLFVDSDVVINETVVDKLIEADKDAVTAIYHKKSLTVQQSEIYRIDDGKRFEAYPTAEVPQTLFEITACGFGCNCSGATPSERLSRRPKACRSDSFRERSTSLRTSSSVTSCRNSA